jgi:hypothetical protein
MNALRCRWRIAAMLVALLVWAWVPRAEALTVESIDSSLLAAGTARVVNGSGDVMAASVLAYHDGAGVRIRIGLCPELGISCTVVDHTPEGASLTETYFGHVQLSAEVGELGSIQLGFHTGGWGMSVECLDGDAKTALVAVAPTAHEAYLQGNIGDWEVRSPVCGVHAADAHLEWVGP